MLSVEILENRKNPQNVLKMRGFPSDLKTEFGAFWLSGTSSSGKTVLINCNPKSKKLKFYATETRTEIDWN